MISLKKIEHSIFEKIFSLERDGQVEFSGESNRRQHKDSEERENYHTYIQIRCFFFVFKVFLLDCYSFRFYFTIHGMAKYCNRV